MHQEDRTRRFVRWCYRTLIMVISLVAVAGLAGTASAGTGRFASSDASAAGSLPCDIFGSDGTPCVAAYSMDRALYAGYGGPLYQVTRTSDGATRDIGQLPPGGYVDASQQDHFCDGTCKVTKIYDQSTNKNDLTTGPGGGADPVADAAAVASALPITIGGNEAYGLDIENHAGYRDDGPTGNGATNVAKHSSPEGMYMVASGTHVNSDCCFDFGNAESDNHDDGAGTMDAVNLGKNCFFPPPPNCSGPGPWVQADLENGLFQQGAIHQNNPNDLTSGSDFVTAVLNNNGTDNFQLEGGNAQSGGLTTFWNGALPGGSDGMVTWAPMKKQGAIILGIGGDNSNSDEGSFFEGAMTQGVPSAAADAAVQASIVSAGYAGNSGPSPTPSGSSDGAAPSAAGPAVVHAAGATGGGAAGFSSVYTVDAANGHLQETYLPAIGASWTTQDLSAKYGTPPVMAGTKPVAVVHCGFTSVYTVNTGGDLEETYLPKIGVGWTAQDLSLKYGTPPTRVTPTAVVHFAGATGAAAACGFTSVYTVNTGGDLQETYLPVIAGPWTTQDLSAKYGTPPVAPGIEPVALVHTGYTSVFTVDAADSHLQETYLSNIGNSWATHDVSALSHGPTTAQAPSVLLHPDPSGNFTWTSAYTIVSATGHLQETYLPVIRGPWTTQDLSAKYGTPPASS